MNRLAAARFCSGVMMALTTTANVLTALGLPTTSANTTRYDAIRVGVEKATKSWCKWGIEAVSSQIDYMSGSGTEDIILRNPYVSSVTDVWEDPTGYWNSGSSPYAAATKLTKGTDYALVLDDDTGGKSGRIRRLQNTAYLFYSDLVFARRYGGLSYRRGVYWPPGYGNVKVQYAYGFSTIPDDIILAVWTACAIVGKTVKYGGIIGSESMGDYQYSIQLFTAAEFATVRQLLSRYRDMPVGILG